MDKSVIQSVAVLLLLATAAKGADEPLRSDQICGPRCVHWLLRSLTGADRELHEVVKQVNHNSNSRGKAPSIRDLSKCLEAEGVFTRAVVVEQDKQLELSTEPGTYLVAHLQCPLVGTSVAGEGHYVVWLGTDGRNRQLCWDGLRGEVTVDARTFQKAFTGVVLVVADSAQKLNSGFALHAQSSIFSGWRSAVLCTAVVMGGVSMSVFRVFRKPKGEKR